MTFRPSQVVLGPRPLVGCFGRYEREVAAATMILALRPKNDAWGPLFPVECGRAIQAAVADGAAVPTWMVGPFYRPDFHSLVEEGYAEWGPEDERPRSISFTDKGIDQLARWVR